jgi:hypothetical protein
MIGKLAPELPDYALFRALPGAGAAPASSSPLASAASASQTPHCSRSTPFRSPHQAQRQQVLRPLALSVPHLPPPDLRRMGRADHRPCLLPGLPSARHEASGYPSRFHLKWIRVLHRCWTDRIHYDESRYPLACSGAKRRCSRSLLRSRSDRQISLNVRLRGLIYGRLQWPEAAINTRPGETLCTANAIVTA